MSKSLTPPPTTTISVKSLELSTSSATMTFHQAIDAIVDNKKVTKLEWADRGSYCLLANGILQLHKKGEPAETLHPWIINDGDLMGTDWVELQNK